jgi:hypothetical protein
MAWFINSASNFGHSALSFGTAPFRWAYSRGQQALQSGKENIINPALETIKKNIWYTSSQALANAHTILKNLYEAIPDDGQIPDATQLTNLHPLARAAVIALRAAINEVTGRNTFYKATNQEIRDLRKLEASINKLEVFLRGNQATPCQIPFVALGGKSGFFQCFSSVLRFTDRWGISRGPIASLHYANTKQLQRFVQYTATYPFPPEFEEVLQKLDDLHRAIEEGNPQNQLAQIRKTWAFCHALLELGGDSIQERFRAQPQIHQSLVKLTRVLQRSKTHEDPRLAEAVQQARQFLTSWRNSPRGGVIPNLGKRLLLGKSPSLPPPQRLHDGLLQRSSKLEWLSMPPNERQALFGGDLILFQNQRKQEHYTKVKQANEDYQSQTLALPNTFKDQGILGKALNPAVNRIASSKEWIVNTTMDFIFSPTVLDLPPNSTVRISFEPSLREFLLSNFPSTNSQAIHTPLKRWMNKVPEPLISSSQPSRPSIPSQGRGRLVNIDAPVLSKNGREVLGLNSFVAPDPTSPAIPGSSVGTNPSPLPPREGTLASVGAALENSLILFKQLKKGDLDGAANTLRISQLPQMVLSFGATKAADVLSSYIGSLNPDQDSEKIDYLRPLEQSLRQAGTTSDLSNASKIVQQILTFLGFDPDEDEVDYPDLQDLQTKIDNTLQFNKPTTSTGLPLSQAIEKQNALFVTNNSSFVTMKVLFEFFCHLKLPDPKKNTPNLYVQIINEARAAGPEHEASVLKDKFMQALEEQNVDILSRGIIRFILFPFLMWITKKYLGVFAKNGLQWSREFINQNNTNTSMSLPNRAIKRTVGFLNVVEEGYKAVATKSPLSGAMTHELGQEISLPADARLCSKSEKGFKAYLFQELQNHLKLPETTRSSKPNDPGMTPDQIYQKTADKLIDTFIEPDFLQLSKDLRHYLGSVHVSDKDGLAGIADSSIHATLVAVSWFLTLCIFPIEWAIRKAILAAAKRYLINGPMVGNLMNASVQSVKRSGYTHALNCVLYDQLREMAVLLQSHYGITKEKHLSSLKKKEGAIDLRNVSRLDKKNLHIFIKKLLTVLEYYKCDSQKELLQALKTPSSIEMFASLLASLISSGEVSPAIANVAVDQFYGKIEKGVEEILGAAIYSILQKDQLERQFYQLMTTVNGIYEPKPEVSPEEFQEKEEGVNLLIDYIINLVITKSIDQQFDSLKSEQVSADQFLEQIDSLSRELSQPLMQGFLNLLEHYSKTSSTLPTNPEVLHRLEEMLQKISEKTNSLINLRRTIETSELSDVNKKPFDKIFHDLYQNLDRVTLALISLQQPKARQLLAQKMEASVGYFNHHLRTLEKALQSYPSPQNLEKANDALLLLSDLNNRFKKEPALASILFLLEKQTDRLRKSISEFEKSMLLTAVLESALDTESISSPLCKWSREIGTTAESAPEIRDALAQVEQALETLSSLPLEQSLLRLHIERLKETPSSTERERLFKELEKVRQDMLAKAVSMNQKAKKRQASANRLCQQALKKMRFEDSTSSTSPENPFRELGLNIQQFKNWAKESRTITIKDTSWLSSISPYLPEGGKAPVKKLKSFIFNNIRSRINGIQQLMGERVFWEHGLFITNLLRPFIQGVQQ